MSKRVIKQKIGCPWCGCRETEICVTAVAWLECEKCGAQNGQQVDPENNEQWAYSDDPLPQRVLDELSELWDERVLPL